KAPDDEFGIAPHTDTSFLTLLAPNDVPGLAFRTQTGDWIDVPTVPNAFIVNGGQLLLRWTNDCFLATPHRAVNRTSDERYALAFFFDPQIDWPAAAAPRPAPRRPPRRPPRHRNHHSPHKQDVQPGELKSYTNQKRGAEKGPRAGGCFVVGGGVLELRRFPTVLLWRGGGGAAPRR